MITLSDNELDALIKRVVRVTLTDAGLLRPQISQRQAFATFGRERIRIWRRRGIINPVKQGSRIFYSTAELYTATKTNLL